MSLFDHSQTLILFLLYALLVFAFSNLLILISSPIVSLSKGRLHHPRAIAQIIASALAKFRMTRHDWKGELIGLIAVSLMALQFSLLPIFSELPNLFSRPDLLFILVFLVVKTLWYFAPSFQTLKGSMEFKHDFSVSSIVLMFLSVNAVFSFKGGGVYAFEEGQHFVFLKSPSLFLLFFLLILNSKIFFLENPHSEKDYSAFSFPHFISKAIWFSFLVWLFIGHIGDGRVMNFLFFIFFTSILYWIYELISLFVPKVFSRKKDQIINRVSIPITLFIVILSFAEQALLK